MKNQSMTLEEIRQTGITILGDHLGPVWMVGFLQQFETGGAIIPKKGIIGWVIPI
ncbi:hypothetical protein H8E88_26170 [candidate division KSB1 bacterium]|nr:hypothetical protein [candidate division KSB1 bacterium]